ncbi:organic cation transporter protein-like [Lineus longissimus]|uniref:organic cation transporter protein-like n=1 Tax=Lineus longissimus TaxID=88925 RepID=UPI00315D824C
MKFDDVLTHHVGQVGRYQWFLYISLTVAATPTAWFAIAMVFVGGGSGGQNYECQMPEHLKNASLPKHVLVPMEVDATGEAIFSKCQYYDHSNSNLSALSVYNTTEMWRNTTLAIGVIANQTSKRFCQSWEYDTQGRFQSTVMEQYKLTCQSEWLLPLVQSFFMIGWLCGNFIFGSLADRYGRMTVIPIGFFLETILGIAVPFVPNYYGALVLKFLLGGVTGGTYTICFVLCLEFAGKKYRPFVASVFHCGFNGGLCVIAGIAYALEPINHTTLQIIIGCFPAFFIVLRWLIPESPRWLVSDGRFQKAKHIVRKIARCNGRPVPRIEDIVFEEEKLFEKLNDLDEKSSNYSKDERIYTVVDLFRTPNIRRIALASFVVWFASAFIYYGFLFISGGIGGNVYINTVISGATGVVSAFITVPLLNYFGRRTTAVCVQVMMAIALFAAIGLVNKPDYETALVIVVSIGKFCNILVFDAIYLHSAEMFPTGTRSLGVGMGSLFARVGALISPLIGNMTIFWHLLPIVVFSAVAVISTLFALLLPETVGRPLPETIEDGEKFAKFDLSGFCPLCDKKTRDGYEVGATTDVELHHRC